MYRLNGLCMYIDIDIVRSLLWRKVRYFGLAPPSRRCLVLLVVVFGPCRWSSPVNDVTAPVAVLKLSREEEDRTDSFLNRTQDRQTIIHRTTKREERERGITNNHHHTKRRCHSHITPQTKCILSFYEKKSLPTIFIL